MVSNLQSRFGDPTLLYFYSNIITIEDHFKLCPNCNRTSGIYIIWLCLKLDAVIYFDFYTDPYAYDIRTIRDICPKLLQYDFS